MIRPLNPKVKTILKVAIPLAVAFVLFIWANARPVPIQVRLTFIGFTNVIQNYTTTNGPLPIGQAYFCMSNAGNCSVFLHLDRIEIKNKPHDGLLNAKFYMGPWTNADDVARDIVTFEMKPGGYDIPYEPPTGIQREPILRVDNRGSLVSDTGTNLEPWRLSLSYYKVDWRVKLLRNPPSVLRKALRFVPAKWLVPRPIEVHSEWINGPPELMPVATKTTNTPPK